MKITLSARTRSWIVAGTIGLVAGATGFGLATWNRGAGHDAPAAAGPSPERKILYWYDPMAPKQHFDKPGKSPFMDMPLVPKYADEGAGSTGGVAIDPALAQNLGVRTAPAHRGMIGNSLTATGTIAFNERDVAIVQPRASGFVQRTYGRAPDDVIAAGAPLVDLLVPEWGGAQQEFLATRQTGDAALVRAARQRLILLGIPPQTIAAVERSGRPRTTITIASPIGGSIRSLGVRTGMSVMAGQTLAEINGLGTVWLDAAVPEAVAGGMKPGQRVEASLAAFPGETFRGRVSAVLPEAESASRTLTVRIELANRNGRMRPGMFASVTFAGGEHSALLVPSEAIIATGKRSIVMLALDKGRYRPAEVRTGRQDSGQTEILAGLAEGEKVVTSGQFLIDSEASLVGMDVRPIDGSRPGAEQPGGRIFETTGIIEKIGPEGITLSHQPVPALKWPAMTMIFKPAKPDLAHGFSKGDRVAFAFVQADEGPMLQRMTKEGGQ